jgi:pimeloyl-ACP methyl ester carboxylesterase
MTNHQSVNKMRYSLILIPFATVLLSSCQARVTRADFTKMDWLIGTWKGETNGFPFYENWVKLSDTEFDNANYTICNGDTVRGGHSKIEIRNGFIAYTSGNLTWNLKELTDSMLVFENQERGERFTFTRTEEGEWKADLKYRRNQVQYLLQRTESLSALLQDKPAPITDYYEGYLEFMNKRLFTSIHFQDNQGVQTAWASTPGNLQLNMPFREVCYAPPFLKLSIRDGTQNLELTGQFKGDEFVGKLNGEMPAKVYFKKAVVPARKNNYRVVPLTLKNGDLELPANLYLPVSDKPTGAVIMICGTGQHIKEEYNGWADLLASQGVAVFTYDKRNVTTFPQLNIRRASSDIVLPGQLESDVEAAIRMLKDRKEINAKKIGLLGFSQGAVIAPVVAAGNPDIAFIIAVSGNTTTDREFIIKQSLNRLRQRNFDTEAINEAEAISNELFAYTRDRKNESRIQEKLDRAYEKGFGQYSLPRQVPNDDEIKYLSTWNSFEHDPSDYWKRLSIPAYVVYGDSDLHIPVRESVGILNNLYQNKTGLLTLKVYPHADHFIKKSIDRDNFDFPKFAEGYIEELTGWIVKQSK